MPTETPTLRIRKATALDAVNLYKLLVDEERKSDTYVEHDQVARVAHILNVIATGYVSIVEKSGRIVGSLGFAPGGQPYALARSLVSEWCFLVPSLTNAKGVSDAMVDRLIRFADKHKVAISITAKVDGEVLHRFLEDNGFVASTLQFARKAVTDEFESDPDFTDAPEAGAATLRLPSPGATESTGPDADPDFAETPSPRKDTRTRRSDSKPSDP